MAHFREPFSATEETRLLEGLETLRTLESRVVPLSLGQQSIYVFVLPIMIEKLRGYLFIVDDSRSNLEYRMHMLQDIENLKIDNDVMNLVEHLELHPLQDLLPGGL